jgi:uncharacterized membrane protein YfcA
MTTQGFRALARRNKIKIVAVGTLIGFVSGFIGSLIGQGGAFISIPLMTTFCGLTQHQAHGTGFGGIFASGLTGALTLYYNGNGTSSVDVKSSLVIGSSALVAAPFGAVISKGISGALLKRYFTFLVLAMIPLSFIRPYLAQKYQKTEETKNNQSLVDNLWNIPLLLGVGGFAGFFSGLFGIGGGVFMVSFLGTMTDQQQAIGTSLLAILFPAISGSLTHYKLGNIFLPLIPALFLGSMIGAGIGSRLVVKMNDQQQRVLFVTSAILICLRNILK